MKQIKAAIFDLDGLLVDSEPHWQVVEQGVFAEIGLSLSLADCHLTTGLPTNAVVEFWYARQPWDVAKHPLADVEHRILAGAHQRIAQFAEPMPGALAVLETLRTEGLRLAIASASPMSLIELVIDRLGIREYFTLWHSATLEKRSKPAPDVYLGAARLLNVAPAECVAFEDSGSGLRSAVSAGMTTVAVPAPYEFDDPKFEIATVKIPSLTAFTTSVWQKVSV